MTTATFVKSLEAKRPGQTVILWVLDPPQGDVEYVITSAVDLTDVRIAVMDSMMGTDMAQKETYIFHADSDGKVLDWGEMKGSTKHIKDHEQVIRNAGWTVVNP